MRPAFRYARPGRPPSARYVSRSAAIRAAVASAAPEPRGALSEDAVALLWRNLEKAGWRIEEVGPLER